jgi:hypothetical protein
MTLPCPQESNYAAVAKQLHATALDVESRIFTLEQELREAVNRPTMVQTFSDPQPGMLDNFEEIFPFGNFTYTFNNTGTAFGVGNNDEIYIALGEGVYEIGVAGFAAASGGVTNNSFRVWQIKQYRQDPGSLDPVMIGYSMVNRSVLTQTEPGTGNEFSFSGVFRIRPRDIIFFTLLHTNTASTLTLSAGTITWMHKLADSNLTEVV